MILAGKLKAEGRFMIPNTPILQTGGTHFLEA